MPRAPLSFGFQSNPGRHGQDGTSRLINAYAENAGAEGKVQLPIYPLEGLTRIANDPLGTGNRGMLGVKIGANDLAYAVTGTQVIEIGLTGSRTTLGALAGSNPVYMARNQKLSGDGTQTVLVTPGQTPVYIEASTLNTLSDGDLPTPNSVTSIASRFVFGISDGRFFWSGLNDITIDALDFATAEQIGDGLVRVFNLNGFLWLFGGLSVEIWGVSVSADSPFALVSGGTVNVGAISGNSVASPGPLTTGGSSAIAWVGNNGVVWASAGASPTRISSHAVERAIQDCADPSTISAMAYTLNGHQWYVISCAEFTWAFDFTTRVWTERKSYGLDRWRGEGYAKIGNSHVVGDYSNGKFYKIDPDVSDEDGNHLVWGGVSPIVHAGRKPMRHNRIDMGVITGTGLNSTDIHKSDPQIELRWSDDGVNTWSSWRKASLGKIGEYSKNVRFSLLGASKEQGRAYEFRCSSPVIRGLLDSFLEVG